MLCIIRESTLFLKGVLHVHLHAQIEFFFDKFNLKISCTVYGIFKLNMKFSEFKKTVNLTHQLNLKGVVSTGFM
jgi:hypothetical protein